MPNLSSLTTLGIGGPCLGVLIAKTEEQLIEFITKSASKVFDPERSRRGVPFLIIGGGSNLLVSDSGVDKVIIKNEVTGIKRDGNILTIKSGTVLQDLVNFSIEQGLEGLQKLTGIPGTLGGAIYGNAGAYGQTISDHLIQVKAFDGEKIITLKKDECGFSYRDSDFKRNGLIILEVQFELTEDNPDILSQEAEEVLAKRLVQYPPGLKCPGSFFKNIIASDLPREILEKIPEDKITYGKISAGYLLESVGAKGDRLGDIEIAQIHGNLFVNLGNGSAQDFYNLAKKYAIKVREKYGIILEPEVQLINLPPISSLPDFS